MKVTAWGAWSFLATFLLAVGLGTVLSALLTLWLSAYAVSCLGLALMLAAAIWRKICERLDKIA